MNGESNNKKAMNKKSYIIIGGIIVVGLIGLGIFLYNRSQSDTQSPQNVPVNAVSVAFVNSLPYSTNNFSIYKVASQTMAASAITTLLITPNITINGYSSPQSQLSSQWGTYQSDAKDAVEYIKKQGDGLGHYKITFALQDFWPSGKSLDPNKL